MTCWNEVSLSWKSCSLSIKTFVSCWTWTVGREHDPVQQAYETRRMAMLERDLGAFHHSIIPPTNADLDLDCTI